MSRHPVSRRRPARRHADAVVFNYIHELAASPPGPPAAQGAHSPVEPLAPDSASHG